MHEEHSFNCFPFIYLFIVSLNQNGIFLHMMVHFLKSKGCLGTALTMLSSSFLSVLVAMVMCIAVMLQMNAGQPDEELRQNTASFEMRYIIHQVDLSLCWKKGLFCFFLLHLLYVYMILRPRLSQFMCFFFHSDMDNVPVSLLFRCFALSHPMLKKKALKNAK